MLRFLLFFFAALLGFTANTHAQSGIGDALTFSGLTVTSGAETYAWLSWNPTDPALLNGRVVAVYRKTGDASSTAPFSRISVVEPVTETRLVSSLLPVSQKVGQDITGLGTMLDDLLRNASPAGSITIAQKISTIVSAAKGDEEGTRRLYVLALQHPAMALCAGVAQADRIPATGAVTYELRDFNKASDRDFGVIGRVTVNPSTPFILPAPGAVVEVPDNSAKGNLNTSLRWASPNALRDVAPLHHGFNLYRVPQAVAEAHGWNTTIAPTTAALTAEPQTRLVNHFPILCSKMLTAAEAADAADTSTVFTIDDHARYQPGGVPFADNSRFYYFVAARDLLGRSGQPAPGTLVTIFDRLPPNPPRHTRVRTVATYNGTVRDQRFFVEWDLPELPPGETVSEWYVYRWRTPHEIPAKSRQLDPVTGKPERNLIAILPVGTREFTDNSTVPPPACAIVDEPAPDAADSGKTYFYTVRAADGSVAANLSGNSAPAWGVLRDRSGPDGTIGTVTVTVFEPHVTFAGFTQTVSEGLTKDRSHFLLTCESDVSRGLDWAEFRYYPLGENPQPILLGHVHFTKNTAGKLVAALRKTIFDITAENQLACRVGTTSGVISSWVGAGVTPAPEAGKYILARWDAALIKGTLPGSRHEANSPLDGTTTVITGTFTPPSDAKTFQIYRRVNDGAQTLITQGKITASPTTWTDSAPLAACATAEYFLQTLDANSNASTLVTQGTPIIMVAALPKPMLEPITSSGSLLNSKMRVKWFCSTAGVERFELWVARKSGKATSSNGSGLSADLASHPNVDTSLAETAGLDFAVYQTGLTRLMSADGTPEFEALLPVSASDTYTVMVRAVGFGEYSTRAVGAFSNVENFTFSLRSVALDAHLPIPWPDRQLPPRAAFDPGIAATYLSTNDLAPWKGIGVRIGEYGDIPHDGNNTVVRQENGSVASYITSLRPVGFYLYINDAVAIAEPLETIPGLILPAMLYRVQVANANFPSVPGDIVQVSPLMEQIAYVASGPSDIAVTDPFVAVLHKFHTDLPRSFALSDHDILLLDRQPVIKGARYKYLLVRFTPGREIERVIVTNTVDVPN